MTVRLLCGDCREVLATLPPESIDACVTDPPYEIGFMGKAWDSSGVAFQADTWRAVLRVLKPGAHLVAFGGARTYHRMACAIEDAGFEIRDQIMWLYGEGFPKSVNVAAAIDKATVRDLKTGELVMGRDTPALRDVCRAIRSAMEGRGMRSRNLVEHFGNCHPRLIDHWAARDTDSQPTCPTWDQWQILKSLLQLGDELDGEVWRLNGRKGQPGEAWQEAEVIGEYDGTPGGLGGERFKTRDNLKRAPATDAARRWQGWGTALKPAHEPIVLARKPFRGTIAENVQRFETGALNIDACRIETGEANPSIARRLGATNHLSSRSAAEAEAEGRYESRQSETAFRRERPGEALGRWPANVLHDGSPEVVAAFPDAPGQESTVHGDEPSQSTLHAFSEYDRRGSSVPRGDTGSAARFFYVPKASREDRDDGLAHRAMRPLLWSSGQQHAGSFQSPNTTRAARNSHPTVKPTELMRYLCRLVTPPGGTVIDPFCGSGSTGRGAFLEQFGFIGIDISTENIEIAEDRIRAIAPLFAQIER